MLLTLSMRNVALIESLTLEFQRGLHVVTGETGAGKSIRSGRGESSAGRTRRS